MEWERRPKGSVLDAMVIALVLAARGGNAKSDRAHEQRQEGDRDEVRDPARDQSGMTLIEIMIVIAILGLMASIAGVYLIGAFETARQQMARTQIRSFQDALTLYDQDCGAPPSVSKGLDALVVRQADCPRWKGYLDPNSRRIPKDPWGRAFDYANPGTHGQPVEIVSRGKDGELETTDDIRSWALTDEGGAP